MRRLFRIILRLLGLVVIALILFGLVFAISGWSAFGTSADGARLQRMEKSAHWKDGAFQNIRAQWLDYGAIFTQGVTGPAVPEQNPSRPVPFMTMSKERLATLPESGLRISWMGHSSTLIEVDGVRVLTDPIWSDRASPVGWAGPARWFGPPITIKDLPPIDAVVISHDHYDHLDMASVQQLAATTTAKFIVPLGVGAHLEYWGIAKDRITEVEWWDETAVGPLRIVATPARHATGRLQPSGNKAFWAGYALVGPKHRVWYSGDTGYLPEFSTIGDRFGPFDVTLIEAGQYNPSWPDNHLGPEQAVHTHKLVRGKVMLPVHWSLFSLAPHGWTEPVERVRAAAACQKVALALPRPGESVDLGGQVPTTQWWPNVPWRDAKATPQLPTQHGDPKLRFPQPACE